MIYLGLNRGIIFPEIFFVCEGEIKNGDGKNFKKKPRHKILLVHLGQGVILSRKLLPAPPNNKINVGTLWNFIRPEQRSGVHKACGLEGVALTQHLQGFV